jgi:hypothetical protein
MELKLTDLEKDVMINGLFNSEFNDTSIEEIEKDGYNFRNHIVVWRECVIDCCKVVTEKQISGVISSLSKKGLVNSNGETVSITEEGVKVLKTLL